MKVSTLIKTVSTALIITFIFSIQNRAFSQLRDDSEPRQSPNATVSQTIGTTKVTVNYGRPSVNDRLIFGELEPYGKVWRTGANEATTISFSDDVMIEGEPLSAGTYGLFTIPGEKEWTIIFNNVPNQWGAFDYDTSKDALRVTVESEKAYPMEQLMFYFEDVTKQSGDCILHWANVRVPFTIAPAESS